MTAKLDVLLDRYGKFSNVILFIMLIIPFNALIWPTMSGHFRNLTSGLSTLDPDFAYLPQTALDRVAAYGAPARAYYLVIEWTADLAYPFIYATLFALLLTFILRRALPAQNPYQRLRLIPYAMMVCDYSENILVSLLLLTFPAQSMVLAWLASIASFFKWMFGGMVVLSLLISLIALFATLFGEAQEPRGGSS
jgi:hypothetical protein